MRVKETRLSHIRQIKAANKNEVSGMKMKKRAISERSLLDRVLREQSAHTQNDVLAKSYQLKNRFKHIWTYPSRRRFDETLLGHLKRLNGAKVLDYGCGHGDLSLYILAQRGEVHGIDISSVYIQDAAQRCGTAGYDRSRFKFYVMDAHSMDFPANFFDIVVGLGILHHLDPDVALSEIHRVLKPGGRVLLQEPLADNPLLKLFRLFTPSARTVDERPFTGSDIKRLKNSPGWSSEMSFCGVLEAPAAVLTSLLMPGRPDNCVLRAADWVEQRMHRAGLLDSWNQYVLINLVKRPKTIDPQITQIDTD